MKKGERAKRVGCGEEAQQKKGIPDEETRKHFLFFVIVFALCCFIIYGEMRVAYFLLLSVRFLVCLRAYRKSSHEFECKSWDSKKWNKSVDHVHEEGAKIATIFIGNDMTPWGSCELREKQRALTLYKKLNRGLKFAR